MSKEAMKLALARLQARTDTADLDAIAALNEALAEQPAQRKPLTNEPNEKLLLAAGIALEVLEKHRQMKGEYPVGMLGVRAVEELKAAFAEIFEAAHNIKENT